MDEPILVTELDADWQHALTTAYRHLKSSRIKLLLATHFGQLSENRYLAANLPLAGLHIYAKRTKQKALQTFICRACATSLEARTRVELVQPDF